MAAEEGGAEFFKNIWVLLVLPRNQFYLLRPNSVTPPRAPVLYKMSLYSHNVVVCIFSLQFHCCCPSPYVGDPIRPSATVGPCEATIYTLPPLNWLTTVCRLCPGAYVGEAPFNATFQQAIRSCVPFSGPVRHSQVLCATSSSCTTRHLSGPVCHPS